MRAPMSASSCSSRRCPCREAPLSCGSEPMSRRARPRARPCRRPAPARPESISIPRRGTARPPAEREQQEQDDSRSSAPPRRPSRGRGSTTFPFPHSRFPGCGSAWKKPLEHLAVVRLEQLARGLARSVTSGARLIGTPWISSITSSRLVDQLGVDARDVEPVVGLEHLAHALDVRASWRKSSSRRRESRGSRARGCRSAPQRGRSPPSRRRARAGPGRGGSRSRAVGRCTFTTTRSPSSSAHDAPGRSSPPPSARGRCSRRRPPTAPAAPAPSPRRPRPR